MIEAILWADATSAHMLADEAFINEVDAGGVMPADIEEMVRQSHLSSWGKGGRAFILNEAHGLRRDSVRKLLVELERIPHHVVWIFTTTCAGMSQFADEHIDASPLLSRCQVMALDAKKAQEPFARLAQRIARRENLDGKPLADYVELVRSKKGNLRAVYQAISGGLMLD